MRSQILLDDVADVRAGDKGDTLILAVVVRDEADYPLVQGELTVERMTAVYRSLLTGPTRRTVLPGLNAMVFSLPGVLGGGVTGSSVLDGHGKTMSYQLAQLRLS